jgi:hypothetical protein
MFMHLHPRLKKWVSSLCCGLVVAGERDMYTPREDSTGFGSRVSSLNCGCVAVCRTVWNGMYSKYGMVFVLRKRLVIIMIIDVRKIKVPR